MNRNLLGAIRRDLLNLCDTAAHPQDFIHEAGRLLSQAVSCDGWIMHAVDPSTLLPSYGVSRYSRFPDVDCWELARREYLDRDVNDFSTLARSPGHVAALGLTTSGAPEVSGRFRQVLRPFGLKDELRVAYVADSACWGAATLVRTGQQPFTASDVRFIASVAPHIGRTLRELAWLGNLPANSRFSPCVLILDEQDRLVEATSDATPWLQELKIMGADIERPLPLLVKIVAHYARPSGRRYRKVDFNRVRTANGRWASLRGVRLHGTGHRSNLIAVIVEPAPAEAVADFLLTGYRLSAREREVARLLAHGRGSKDIAHVLRMSTHTVRDHVKNVLEKADVHTRAELIAKLFVDASATPGHG